MYRIVITDRAKKDLRKIPDTFVERILEAIDELASNPFVGKKLQGEYEGNYGIRMWPYRIVYRIEKKILTVSVIKIGHRQGIYK